MEMGLSFFYGDGYGIAKPSSRRPVATPILKATKKINKNSIINIQIYDRLKTFLNHSITRDIKKYTNDLLEKQIGTKRLITFYLKILCNI